MMQTANDMQPYDVAILGTGIGGTILGTILARHGLRVLLLEQGAHPRFAIGESTVPETTFLFRMLALRYGVPEVGYLASYQLIRRHVGTTCGIKRNFSFVYHRPGAPQQPQECTQYPTAAPPYGPDVHLFRQDIDAYMLSVALRYGAHLRVRTSVRDVAIDGDGVTLTTSAGEAFRSRYVVDAGGIQSLLAKQFNLRDNPCPLRTHSRSLFTHMVGVHPYDNVGAPQAEHGLPIPLSQGTLHHLFKDGWMWVIPFDNHPAATNRLCSVGVNFNTDRSPPTGESGEAMFARFLAEYPSIAAQFTHATPVREWTVSDRLQFSSKQIVGDRWALLPHAASFVDPLYSSGLGITMSAIDALARRLIPAAVDDDFSADRFQFVEDSVRRNIDYYDRLVFNSYTAFADFDLWNAWTRLWMIGGLYGTMAMLELNQRCERARDKLAFDDSEKLPYRSLQASELPEFAALMAATESELDAYRAGRQSSADSSRNIFSLTADSQLWPAPWGPLRPEKRHPGTFTFWPLYKTGRWARNHGPENVRKHYFVSASLPGLAWFAARDLLDEAQHALSSLGLHSRDYVANWNKDYAAENHQTPPALVRADAAPLRPADVPVTDHVIDASPAPPR